MWIFLCNLFFISQLFVYLVVFVSVLDYWFCYHKVVMSVISEDFEEEGWTIQDRYQFSPEEIANSPSRAAGITEESENRRRIEAAVFIKHVSNHFLPKSTE